IVFPLDIHIKDINKPLKLKAKVDFLVCNESCIPEKAEIELDIQSGKGFATPTSHLITRFKNRIPNGKLHGIELVKAVIETKQDSTFLRVEVDAFPRLKNPDLFIENKHGLWFSAPYRSYEGNRVTLRSKLKPETIPEKGIAGLPMKITVVDGNRGMEADITPAVSSKTEAREQFFILYIFVIALLGGFILNFMPCVLPVLSLKFFSLVTFYDIDFKKIRLNFIASAMGIICSFIMLAAIAVAIKFAGASIGWGIQFQQPYFLIIMAVILTLFTANMMGLFEFPLAECIAVIEEKTTAKIDAKKYPLIKSFLIGAFAALLATPCSAPFLGTAVGFALSQGAIEIFVIFTALGIGMAAPYFLVASMPHLVLFMPCPGPWINVLKRFLALVLAGTVVWVLSVLFVQIGSFAICVIGFLMFVIVAVLAVWHRKIHHKKHAIILKLFIFAVIIASVVITGIASSKYDHSSKISADDIWLEFDRNEINRLVADGKTVLVDVTADWCLTCRWNKMLVLSGKTVAKAFNNENIVGMRADWTKPDKEISKFLNEYGRVGVPFNIVYGAAAPEGIPLSEILSTQDILKALNYAAGKTLIKRESSPIPLFDRRSRSIN
ncbi:MAG: thioredoxin family protein, partial [Alphaproteobacteria bacterium]|nr:thioredoxin family protein [Alphaproteobacteria bacterium]